MPATALAIRLAASFDYVVARAAKRVPWLLSANLRFCDECDRDHKRQWRLFMHTGHYRMTVCVARASETELTDKELVGMFAHELGHVVGVELGYPEHGRKHQGRGLTPKRVQDEADMIARRVLGFRTLRYNKRTLEEA